MPRVRQFVAEGLGLRNAGATHQNRAARRVNAAYFFDYRAPARLFFGKDHIREIFANHRLIGGDGCNREPILLPEFFRLRCCGAGHAANSFIHSDQASNGDGAENTALCLQADSFLRFDGGVQPRRPPPVLCDAPL